MTPPSAELHLPSFVETVRLSHIGFRFKDRSSNVGNFVSKMAATMGDGVYPPAELLSGPYLLEFGGGKEDEPTWPEGYREALLEASQWLDFNKCRVMLVGAEVETLVTPGKEVQLPSRYTGSAAYGIVKYPGAVNFQQARHVKREEAVKPGWQEEPWYGQVYRVEKLDASLIESWKNPESNVKLHFPHPNEFIPLHLISNQTKETPASRPRLIQYNDRIWTFYKADDRFATPRTNVICILRCPLVYSSPFDSILAKLYCDLVKDALSEETYDAEVAGCSFTLDMTTEGFYLSVDGYTEKMEVLLSKVLNKMKNVAASPNPERFTVLKEQMERSLKSWDSEGAQQHASWWCTSLLQEKIWTNAEKREALPALLDASVVSTWVPRMLDDMHIEALVHGSMDETRAKKLTETVWVTLHPTRVLPVAERCCNLRTVIVPPGNWVFSMPLPNKEDPNSAIEYYLQLGDVTDCELRVMAKLFGQIAQEPAFDTLRTKEQLGYLVWSGTKRQTGIMGWRCVVQGSHHPSHVETRIEAFLDKIMMNLIEMTDEEFLRNKKALEASLLETPKNLASETSRFWSHVNSRLYDFDSRREEVVLLQGVTMDNLIDWCKRKIVTSPERRKLSCWVTSQLCKSIENIEDKKYDYIDDASMWKMSQQLGPSPFCVWKGGMMNLESTPSV
jgi:insulysin